MSNNLRQIAKDLRSFVKRCKDVHYSDSLLITFLVTGLLTFAPRLHADVETEQQEVSAQTYDAITDLRQSFIRARKENEKSLKGAERELAMLLQQGDQVIKSPWASFQFGTGFANNDWGTTYRGRGGKFLEYYRRDNDLTKYVFDKSKHLYGATDLNIPRNQEPNSLVINPANIHEPYAPYEVTRMDRLTLFNNPSFNTQLLDAVEGHYGYTRPNPNPYRAFNELGYWTTTRLATHNYSRRWENSAGTIIQNDYANNSSNSSSVASATGGTASTATWTQATGVHGSPYEQTPTNNRGSSVLYNTSGSFVTGGTHSWTSKDIHNVPHGETSPTEVIGAYYDDGTNAGRHSAGGTVKTGHIGILNASSQTITNTGITMEDGKTTGIKVTGTGTVTGSTVNLSSGTGGVGVELTNGHVTNMTINVNGSNQTGIKTDKNLDYSNVTISLSSGSNNLGVDGGSKDITSHATIQHSGNNHSSNVIGIKSTGKVTNSGSITLNSDGNVTGISGTDATNNGTITINNYNGIGNNNVGVYGSTSATNNSGHNITVSGHHNNAGLIAPTVTNYGTISVTGSYGDGIYANTNHATSSGTNSSITVTGSYNDGVKGTQNANLLSGSTVTMQNGNYNNGVHAVGGNASVTGSSRINLYRNNFSNGVYAPNGTTTVTNSNIYVGDYNAANDTNNSNYSNGINLVKSGVANSITGSQIYMKGSNNIGVRAQEPGTLTFNDNTMTMSGTGNYGLYLAPSKSITTITGNSTTSSGSSNVGIFISEDAKITTISGGSHTVNGTTSTGIDIHTTKDTTISGTTFNVNNYSSTGIRAGRATHPDDTSTGKLNISGSTFNVLENSSNDGSTGDGNSASAVYLYNVTKTTVNPTTTFNINRNSIGFEVENSGHANREIAFTGQNNSSYVIMNLRNSQNKNTSGQRDGNIGFNIINGNFGTRDTTRGIKVHGNFDSHIESDENVLFNNQQYASKLEFVVGAGAGVKTMDARNHTGQGTILVGTDPAYNAGRKSGYNKNVIFANLGWVSDEDSKVDLNHISVDGNYNTVAFFNRSIKGTHGWTDINNAYHPTGYGRVGWFEGTVRLQGVIGSSFYESTNKITSTGNVGVYAISGQRGENTTTGFDGVRTGWIGAGISSFGGTDKALKNLNVTDLNLGFSRYSEGGVLVYAGNGTAVDVANDSATNNLNNTKTISDGVFHDTSTGNLLKWGYSVPIGNTSHNTTMFFAKGTWKGDNHGFLPATYGNTENAPTEINVKSAVDMVSRQGTAYRAKDGATINVGSSGTPLATRAGGYNSIIALAEGTGTDRNSKLISERTGAAGNNSETGSRVEINGNIVAADNAMFSETARVMNGREDFNAYRANTYENVAAYASGGGDVVINKTAVSNTVLEGASGKNITADTKAAGVGSLIYGMGAYATGEGSNVIYKSGVSIVSGKNGALFATDKGYIEFQGNIVNQNNTKDTIQTSAHGFSGAETRKGKNTATSASSNDHTDTTPFYVLRNAIETGRNSTAITFTDTTRLDMYDGRLLTGNEYQHAFGWKDYSGAYSDYYKEKSIPAAGGIEENKYWAAKYRGMSNVEAHILSNNVDLGIVNQAEGDKKLTWNDDRNASSSGTNFLAGIAKYAGGMNKIDNYDDAETDQRINDKHSFKTTLINGEIDVTAGTVDLTDNFRLQTKTMISGAAKDKANDPFTDIAMESEKVNISAATTIYGNAKNLAGQKQGLNMANSLFRWDSDDLRMNNFTGARYRRSKVDESGYWNKGNINIWGGSASDAITAVNVAYGTVENAAAAKIYADHGNAIVGTDGSKLVNKGKIAVTGIYNPDKQVTLTGGSNTGLATIDRTAETAVTDGENYGIVGISTANARDNAKYRAEQGTDRYGENAIAIENVASGTDGTIAVDGKRAVGIYAQNTHNDSNTVGANKTKVTIKYDNMQATPASADAIKVNSGQNVGGIDTTAVADKKEYRGVGIALVNRSTNADNDANRGGVITLNTLGKAANPDIRTQHNGIGVYAEGSDIVFGALSEGLTVNTKNDGAGIWVTDNSNISSAEDRLGTQIKALNYNYKGDNDKKGFGMIFGSTLSSNKVARNYLDIKFNNNNGTMDLATAKALEARGFAGIAAGPTYKGIAGILVNTDAHNGVTGDRAINYGDIKEQNSTTNVRSYGAVVNKGGFENWGNITLSDSLNELAKNIKTEDLKKANIGILANDHSANARYNTFIENHGDITIGDSTNDKNIGSWAIYGYNITTGAKADGTKSKITVNKNNNGIYSGDGNVNIQQTKILVGNDTVMGHVQHSWEEIKPDGTRETHWISRQTQYANPNNLLSALDAPRKRDSVIGVYIDNNQSKSNAARDVNISADMDIDRFSYGIVMAEKNGGAATNVTIGSPTEAPTIRLAHSTSSNAGGQVKSVRPSNNPKVPKEVEEQGNAVYYYSLDTASAGKTYANVTMNGDYNTAYYTKGSIDNYGTIDLRSKYDVDNKNSDARGFGNIGIFSSNTNVASTNYGTITTGMSDTINMRYSAAMAAGRNTYNKDGSFAGTKEEGYIVNRGTINVEEKEGIGMFATGHGSKALNYGTINLKGEESIGMYLDRGAIGENHGTITGNARNLSGVVAINGGYIKNYGTIKVEGNGSHGIVTDGRRFTVDANGNRTEILPETATNGVTAGQTNGHGGTDLYGGKESSIEEGTTGNPKTTGVGTTITAPDIVPITKVSVDGIDTPVFNVESDAANPGDVANKITVASSIQTGGTRIIDLNTKDEWGNPAWPHRNKGQLSEVTSIGMYVDTSGVRYTNPIDGIENLRKLSKVNLYFGPEATLYTNSKAIRIGDKYDENGNLVAKSNILKPFNDALSKLPGGAKINPLSASLTWQVLAKISADNQLREVYMSKVPYHSFAFDNDKSLVNFTNNLDNIYEIARPGSPEKIIFNKLNSLGNGEGHILAQAFDQMRGHIYGGVQQRIKATSDIIGGEIKGLRNDSNGSKDSNKFKAFGQRNEFKTDTAGMPDWYSNAGGFAYVHEDETVRLGESSGWYAGVVNNYFTFKDLSKS
ncbi:autotransporter-associated N-terminal domain-containing protein, partial [Leptotrichia trevisanii]|uniref:autotransporter-associated N-terminal domain-containing protein n=1 Tax=Leptotrichia trevisanii TaxID=109328 RepID=UPI00055E3131